MTVVEVKIDSSPRGVQRRLNSRNTKNELARALREIRVVVINEETADAAKLQQIEDIIAGRIFN